VRSDLSSRPVRVHASLLGQNVNDVLDGN